MWAPKQNPLVLFWSKEADFEGVSKRQLKCCASGTIEYIVIKTGNEA